MFDVIRVKFAGHDAELDGRLHHPFGEARAYALFAHCFTCSKDIRAAVRIASELARQGIAVLRFDFTGLGASEGDFADTTLSSNIEDLVAAADFLRAEYDAPRLLVGHSLGGAAVLAAAARIPEASAVVTLGAPAEADHIRQLIEPAGDELESTGEAQVSIGGRPFRIKRALLDDLERHASVEHIRALDRALLVMHAPDDAIVDIEDAHRIFDAAQHPKSFMALAGADHLLSTPAHAEYAARVIGAWAQGQLPALEQPELSATESGEVQTRIGASGFATTVRAGRHALRSDEPRDVGGTDTGPNPYDLLLAALGSCTAMTVRMYADRKNWPLSGVHVRLTHKKIHAKECADCEQTEGKLDWIERQLRFSGDLSEEQTQRLKEIAGRCPVHRTLTEGRVRVQTELLG